MYISLPPQVFTLVTTQGVAMLNSSLMIDRVVLGISSETKRANITQVKRAVADFDATSSFDGQKIRIHTILEYGDQLGVHEIGLYSGDKLFALIGKEITPVNYQPILLMKRDCGYAVDITIDTSTISANYAEFDITIDERDEFTYAMNESKVSLLALISSDAPNDLKLGSDNKLLSQPVDVDYLQIYLDNRGSL